MAERIRLIIDTEEDLRLAVRLASVKTGRSTSEVINDLIRAHLPEEVRDARKYASPKSADAPPRKGRASK